jgi:CRISPR system Cascade subunit CasC
MERMKTMKTNERLYMDVHILQTVPPSCINRDDTGSPKSAIYGGVTRARVSSQAWKKAIREYFDQNCIFTNELSGKRTKHLTQMVHEAMQGIAKDLSIDLAVKLLAGVKIQMKKTEKTGEYVTKALFFMSKVQAEALAQIIKNNALIIDIAGSIGSEDNSTTDTPSGTKKDKVKENAKKVTSEQKAEYEHVIEQSLKSLKSNPGIDIALFGRMVADDPSLNTDACAQVAHSISTHKVINEYDYFTAVDDLAPEDNVGAGHIDTQEFNSSTLYRYATVAVHELHRQLGGDTVEAISAFLQAFVCAMPTGKQNTFANRTLPDAVLVTLRIDQPINLVGAFEKPVPAGNEGYVDASAARLIAHAKNTYRDFAGEPILSLTAGRIPEGLGNKLPFRDLVAALAGELQSRLGSVGDRS